jgi:hypothetical protein
VDIRVFIVVVVRIDLAETDRTEETEDTEGIHRIFRNSRSGELQRELPRDRNRVDRLRHRDHGSGSLGGAFTRGGEHHDPCISSFLLRQLVLLNVDRCCLHGYVDEIVVSEPTLRGSAFRTLQHDQRNGQ